MRKIIWSALIMAAVFCNPAVKVWAQNSNPEPPREKRDETYRLDFSINELDDGKKINVRHYSMNQTGGTRELKIGNRVPVEAEQGKFQYLDVGTNIRSKVYGTPDAPILDVNAEISNLAVADQNTHGGQPIVRQMVISGSTLLVFDKPIIIGSVDDPNSKRQYQLEVTATKLK